MCLEKLENAVLIPVFEGISLSIHVEVSSSGCSPPCSCTYRISKQSFRGIDCLTRLTAQFSHDQYKADALTFTLMQESWHFFFFFFAFITAQSSHLINSKSVLESQLNMGKSLPCQQDLAIEKRELGIHVMTHVKYFQATCGLKCDLVMIALVQKKKIGLLDQKLVSYMYAQNLIFRTPI